MLRIDCCSDGPDVSSSESLEDGFFSDTGAAAGVGAAAGAAALATTGVAAGGAGGGVALLGGVLEFAFACAVRWISAAVVAVEVEDAADGGGGGGA